MSPKYYGKCERRVAAVRGTKCPVLFFFLPSQVMEFLYANNMAFHYPEPADKNRYIRSKVWTYEYESFMPDVYDWPESKVH